MPKQYKYLPSEATMNRILESAMLLFLALYPLRHIHIGLDMMDTGYSLSNYRYMGLESMDSMWLFSTYLSNAIGHFLTLLPGGHTLLGMNLYTGLVVSLMAVLSWFFCHHALKMPSLIAFLGEVVAISLCWCPTTVLYNYITYLFLLISTSLIYHGLTKNNHWLLIGAGVFLGLNVFVRFSNLPEVLLIFAVWGYGVLEAREKCKGESSPVKHRERTDALLRTLWRTLFCFIGYAAAWGTTYLYLAIRYGFSAYFQAISKLFGMTEQAQDYTMFSMLYSLFNAYRDGMYWFLRISFFAVVGILLCGLAKFLDRHFDTETTDNERYGVFRHPFSFLGLAYFLSIVLAIAAFVWLMVRKFTSGFYFSYDSILHPGIVFLILTCLVCLQTIFFSEADKSEKLMAGLVFLLIWITPLGSNNVFLPALNNLFLVAPFLFWRLYRLWIRKEDNLSDTLYGLEEQNWKKNTICYVKGLFSNFPLEVTFFMTLFLCFVQFTLFGWTFVFSESTGVQNPTCEITGNPVLEGIRMPREKAEVVFTLSQYVRENSLTGEEVILFGQNPSLSFYLEMPSAFQPWCILDSYKLSELEKQLDLLQVEYEETGTRTVVIIDNDYVAGAENNPKWTLLLSYLSDLSYEETFTNGRYSIYR